MKGRSVKKVVVMIHSIYCAYLSQILLNLNLFKILCTYIDILKLSLDLLHNYYLQSFVLK